MPALWPLLRNSFLFQPEINIWLQSNFRGTILGFILAISQYSEALLLLPLITLSFRTTRLTWGISFTLALGFAWAVGMKPGWPRPPAELWLFDIVARFPGPSASFGFPSGDALAYGAMLVYLLTHRWRWPKYEWIIKAPLGILFSLWVVFGRVFLGVHYLGDTLIGFILGLLLGLIAVKIGYLPRLAGGTILGVLILDTLVVALVSAAPVDWPRFLTVATIGFCFFVFGQIKNCPTRGFLVAIPVWLAFIIAAKSIPFCTPLAFLWGLLFPYLPKGRGISGTDDSS